ncbi:MAG: hypothetical protein L6406_14785 [Desulfobacterales bacterium]|nr:hypothetical protein [Desulfobacterales bacterium]
MERKILKKHKNAKDKKSDNPMILLPKHDAPPKKWHPTHLRNAMTIRQYLSRICNKLEHGEIEVKISNGIANICNVLLRSLEQGELAAQLKQLAKDVEELKIQMEEKKC